MTTNKNIVINYLQAVWEDRDLSAIDNFFAKDAVIHSPLSTVQGQETMKDIMEKWQAAFPELSILWEDFIAEGDKVVCRWKACGTYIGGFFNTSPSHKEVVFSGVMTYRLDNGKIVEYWNLVDMHSILTQLGEFSSMSEALE